MVNKRFGILTVLFELQERNKNGHILYRVVCDCGKEKDVLGSSLRQGLSKSCNCCHLLKGTHGMWKTKVFRTWTSMLSRCSNPKDPNYKNYGLRGITVCESWKNSFVNFYNYMGDSNGLTLDRIDVNKGYYKENCRWANMKTQSRNKRNNKLITYKGDVRCASEWCEILNMSNSTFHNRLLRGWSIEKTIDTPILNKRK